MVKSLQMMYDFEIEQIAAGIFSTMLTIDLVPAQDEAVSAHQPLVTTVQIVGEFTGSVVLSLSPPMAQSAAAAMFEKPVEKVTELDRLDVAAELVNMIGGNIKSLLPGPSRLSLPTVIAGDEFGLRVHDAELINDVWLCSTAGALHICVYEKIDV